MAEVKSPKHHVNYITLLSRSQICFCIFGYQRFHKSCPPPRRRGPCLYFRQPSFFSLRFPLSREWDNSIFKTVFGIFTPQVFLLQLTLPLAYLLPPVPRVFLLPLQLLFQLPELLRQEFQKSLELRQL